MLGSTGPDRAQINRVIGQLDILCEHVTAQEFGRAMQRVLGYAFETLGWTVTFNAVGVPDLRIECLDQAVRLAVEVKTGDPIVISSRDLDGVTASGQTGVVAALVFPDFWPRWCFADARALKPGRYELRRLARKPPIEIDGDVQSAFLAVVDALPTGVLLDPSALRTWGDEQRGQEWRSLRAENASRH